MNDDDFNIFLPSNVKGATENYISHYRTTLAAPIQLNPNETYEVGLHSCIYPTTAINAFDATMAFYSYTFYFEMPMTIPNGYYGTIDLLVAEINKLMSADQGYYKFSVDSNSHKVILQLISGDHTTVPSIKFSKNLQVLLGMPEEVHKEGYIAGEVYDLSGGIGSMYIYTNICRYSHVGGSTAPLLAVVPYSNTSITTFGDHMSYEPRKVLYHPLTTTTLTELQIDVRTKFGLYLPFASGEFLVVLSVRKRGLKL